MFVVPLQMQLLEVTSVYGASSTVCEPSPSFNSY